MTESNKTTLREKYRPVLNLVHDYAEDGGAIREDGGMLHVRATVRSSYERDVIREKIEEVAGDVPSDLSVDISVSDPALDDEGEPKREIRELANRRIDSRSDASTPRTEPSEMGT